MRLLSLAIKNFRQYYGDQRCEFAVGDAQGRVVTVFHGYNGAGKTALLNAFIWGLYGETTDDLEAADKLENEAAVEETAVGSDVEVSVTLVFERPEGRYRVSRRRVSVKDGPGQVRVKQDSLDLFRVGDSGELEPIDDSEAKRTRRIEQFLPKSLYPFFFFNGERVERIASAEAYESVEAGVKTLLDVEVYERGERHLKDKVLRELTSMLGRLGDSKLAGVSEELGTLKAKNEELRDTLQTNEANLGHLADQIAEIENKQGKIEHLADLAKERDHLKADLARVKSEIADAKRRIAELLSRDGYLSFSEPVLRRVEDLIADARLCGEIPSRIKPQFVDDLIAAQECICGAPVEAGSAAHQRLMAWRNLTGMAALEERISVTAASLGHLRKRRDEFNAAVSRYSSEIQRLVSQRRNLESSLAIVLESLGDHSNGEDAARLAETLKRRQHERDELRASILMVKRDISANEESQSELMHKLKALETQNDRANVLKRQIEAVGHVARALADITKVKKEDVRQSLDDSIDSIWEDAAIKPYRASISEDYRLILMKQVGGIETPVFGASTGEKQVLALSFVGSLVKKARENFSIDIGVQEGGYYPIIMDSPFGSLEDDYRAKVAEWIPRLADQVIVFVSKSQWREEVEKALNNRIGKQYILELHTSKEGATRTIEIRGESHPYVVSTYDPNEKTLIKEV